MILYTCIACAYACPVFFFLFFLPLVLCISIGRIGFIILILILIFILNGDIAFYILMHCNEKEQSKLVILM